MFKHKLINFEVRQICLCWKINSFPKKELFWGKKWVVHFPKFYYFRSQTHNLNYLYVIKYFNKKYFLGCSPIHLKEIATYKRSNFYTLVWPNELLSRLKSGWYHLKNEIWCIFKYVKNSGSISHLIAYIISWQLKPILHLYHTIIWTRINKGDHFFKVCT